MTFLLVFQLSNHPKTEKARIADDAFWMTAGQRLEVQ